MSIREFMAMTKALADETRVRMLLALGGGELCVCQITELLASPPPPSPSICRFFIRRAWSIHAKTADGSTIRCLPNRLSTSAREAIRWVAKSLAEEARTVEDSVRLRKILNMDPIELCKRQCRN